jgi:hypothetical protein
MNAKSFSHNDLTRIEWTTQRAVNAVRSFADDRTKLELDAAMYVLQEVRNAALYICEKDGEYRKEAIDRLLWLFEPE